MSATKLRYSFLVARTQEGVIGCENKLPWHIPSDLKKFRELTWGKPIIMGRRTYDSIGRPLPGRTNIVISRNNGLHDPGLLVVRGKLEAMQVAEREATKLGVSEIVVIGGEQVFALFAGEVQTVYLTEVHASIDGDTFFDRKFEDRDWELVSSYQHDKTDTSDEYDYTFFEFRRRPLVGRPFRAAAFEIA